MEWGTGAVAFPTLASALWQSRKPEFITPYRLLDIMYLFQAIAASGLLDLNYLIVCRSFTFNAPSFQTSIDNMRNRTGGHPDDVSRNTLALTNRKSSPYNAVAGMPTFQFTSFADGAIFSSSEDNPDVARLSGILVLAATDVQTATSTNITKQGLPVWLTTVGVPPENAFMNVHLVRRYKWPSDVIGVLWGFGGHLATRTKKQRGGPHRQGL